MKLRWATLAALTVIAALSFMAYYLSSHGDEVSRLTNLAEWQRMASPGELSKAHSFLSHNCTACHTPVKGVEATNCIVCHANNESLLKRQPTSFHANIGSCVACHREHQGESARITQMDHNALVSLGLQQLRAFSNENDEEEQVIINQVMLFLAQNESNKSPLLVNPHLSTQELTLHCASCHQNKDKHFKLFGDDCSACHETAHWSLSEFRHPSPSSMDCAQCHQAPPSHYMEHFNMISKKVAHEHEARVDQCFLCHQTTLWTDIKGVGFYKHH
ncbi:TPA: hypothetical protein ACGG3U_001262 [Legionella pneumophila]|nr:hypothetical protein [Legionella pneumophila]WBV62281.1 hypothetical protein PGH43_10000 [Legionella pneumophila 130b]AGH54237.1 hypothetical protein LPE509_02146 [Legionella pneumophila subsp. pneumophila LPE509]AOU04112.1 hypothetical protein A9E97_05150 [Legionella pneumophila]AOU07072.1 hypothetical protein A9E98_05155 [Legionella pneumophila]AOU10075.1 hypothetical protein A9F03_05340 [Legionella pneumophila]